METTRVEIPRNEAAKLWRKYQSHKHNRGPLDEEIQRIYHNIAKGRTVIKALESIIAAGIGNDRLPKLALVRADAPFCFLRVWNDGSASFGMQETTWGRIARDKIFRFPGRAFPHAKPGNYQALTPHIPPDIRPARGLENYHILFEADWTKAPPVDPILLRRIGRGDAWLVCGAWDLTEVERAVMAGRLP